MKESLENEADLFYFTLEKNLGKIEGIKILNENFSGIKTGFLDEFMIHYS